MNPTSDHEKGSTELRREFVMVDQLTQSNLNILNHSTIDDSEKEKPLSKITGAKAISIAIIK